MNVNWNGDGWNVNANLVSNPYRWNAGNQVFSRNSFLFSRLIGREFLIQDPFSNRRAFSRSHSIARRLKYIFYYQELSAPRRLEEKILAGQVFPPPFADREVFVPFLDKLL